MLEQHLSQYMSYNMNPEQDLLLAGETTLLTEKYGPASAAAWDTDAPSGSTHARIPLPIIPSNTPWTFFYGAYLMKQCGNYRAPKSQGLLQYPITPSNTPWTF